MYAIALAAFKASGASRPHVVEVFVNEADLRAAVEAVRAPLLAELEQAAEWARSSRDFRERQIRDLAAGRDAARAEVAAIWALHVKERGDLHDEYVDRCAHCTEICAGTILWPCPTIRSLNGDTDG